MDKQPDTAIADEIERRIKAKQIHMHSRAHFVFGAVALGFGLAMTCFLAVFSIAVSIFHLRVHEPFLLLGAEKNGLQAFMSTFPWIPLMLSIVCIVGGIFIMKRYDFSYRHAFGGILIGCITTVALAGFLIDVLGFPRWAEGSIPIRSLTRLNYENEIWISGTAQQPTDKQMTVYTPEGHRLSVIIDEETVIHPESPIQQGDWVQILGEREGNSVFADDIFHHEAPRGVRAPEPEKLWE